MTNVLSQRGGHLDGRLKNPPYRSSGSRADRTLDPCNKPDLTASVPSPHHSSHQPTSALPSPQGWSLNISANSGSFQEPQPHHFHHLRSRRRDRGRFLLSPPPPPPPPPFPSPLLIYLQNLPRVNTTGYQAERLHDIVCDASNSSKKSAIFERLSRYPRDVFPPGSPHYQPAAATNQQQQARRQARRREYATTQRH